MSAYTGVVFDLDGTLVDSSQDITNALNRTLAPFGARALSAREVTPLLGEGPYRLVEDAIILAGADVPDVESITAAYLADYRKNPIEESTLFEHVAEALAAPKECPWPYARTRPKRSLGKYSMDWASASTSGP
jgi:phosphoglycolate phosphatase